MCPPAYQRALAFAQRLKDLTRLRRVRDRIDREYAAPLDVDALARGAGIPARHLVREFGLAYGEAPHGYLMARRVERATVLLRHGTVGAAEVGAAVGCPSLPEAFTARFTAWAGVPPTAFGQRAAGARAAPSAAPVRNEEAQVPEPQLA